MASSNRDHAVQRSPVTVRLRQRQSARAKLKRYQGFAISQPPCRQAQSQRLEVVYGLSITHIGLPITRDQREERQKHCIVQGNSPTLENSHGCGAGGPLPRRDIPSRL